MNFKYDLMIWYQKRFAFTQSGFKQLVVTAIIIKFQTYEVRSAYFSIQNVSRKSNFQIDLYGYVL